MLARMKTVSLNAISLQAIHLKKWLQSYSRLSMKFILVISLMCRVLRLTSLLIKLLRTSSI